MYYELNEQFHITDDNTADWALRVIRDNEAERDRLISIAKNQIKGLEDRIQEITDQYDGKSSYLKSCLAEYIMKVPRKDAKTQESYQLLSGKLIIKKSSQKMVPNDDNLVKFLIKQQYPEYIKTKQSVDWAELKKHLKISDGDVINSDTGEVIPTDVIAIEDVPASFDIKLNKEEE